MVDGGEGSGSGVLLWQVTVKSPPAFGGREVSAASRGANERVTRSSMGKVKFGMGEIFMEQAWLVLFSRTITYLACMFTDGRDDLQRSGLAWRYVV